MEPYRKTGLSTARLKRIGQRLGASLSPGGFTPTGKNLFKLFGWGLLGGLVLAGMLSQHSPPDPETPSVMPVPSPMPALSPTVELPPPQVSKPVEKVQRKVVALRQRATPSPKPIGARVQMQPSQDEPKSTQGTLAVQLELYKAGLAFFENEEWRKATRAFRQIIINYPDSPLKAESLYRVVLGLSFQGKCAEALTYFKEAERSSSIAEAYRLRYALSSCNSPKTLSSP